MYSLAEWRREMVGLQKPPDVMKSIGYVLDAEWRQHILRLQVKVILLLTHILFAYSIHRVNKCECTQCGNVYL